jgi:enoyl-[acyl-carrier protein] reductase II
MNNRLCEILNIEKPVIQAPMLWLTSPEMVAAVAEAGGLGTLGVNAGYSTKVTTVEATAERMRETIQRTKALTEKPFAFNYMFSSGIDEFSEACLNVADRWTSSLLDGCIFFVILWWVCSCLSVESQVYLVRVI